LTAADGAHETPDETMIAAANSAWTFAPKSRSHRRYAKRRFASLSRRSQDPRTGAGIMITAIPKKEFDALGPARSPSVAMIAIEKGWFANETRTLIGAILFDRSDKDWN
jgi:hypothetical protein